MLTIFILGASDFLQNFLGEISIHIFIMIVTIVSHSFYYDNNNTTNDYSNPNYEL
jgi:hypothetical protein